MICYVPFFFPNLNRNCNYLVSVVRQAPKAWFSRDGDVPPTPSYTELDSPGAGDGAIESVHVAHHVWKLSKPLSRLKKSIYLITQGAVKVLFSILLEVLYHLLLFLLSLYRATHFVSCVFCFIYFFFLIMYPYVTTLCKPFWVQNAKSAEETLFSVKILVFCPFPVQEEMQC